MITLSPIKADGFSFNPECEKTILTWDEYNKSIVEFFFQQLGTYEKPDYIIGIGEDSFIMGNALSRLFGKSVGYIMTDSKGNLAEHISIIKQPLEEGEEQRALLQTKPLKGKVLVVSLTPFADISKVVEKIKTPFVTEIRTEVLFEKERDQIIVPDEIFSNLDLSLLEPKDLVHLTDDDIYRIAQNLFFQISRDPTKKIVVTDLTTVPEGKYLVSEEQYPSVLNVTWDEYGVMKIQTALTIIQSNSKPDRFIGIARGGLDPAKGCSNLLKVPMGVYHTSSYKQSGECKQSELILGEHISMVGPFNEEMSVILDDDLIDSGRTLIKTKELMMIIFKKVMTAVFFKKPKTEFIPDIYIQSADDRWIVLPDEIFERLNLAEINAVDLSRILAIDENDLAKMLKSGENSILGKIARLTEEVFALLPKNPKETISQETLKKFRLINVS